MNEYQICSRQSFILYVLSIVYCIVYLGLVITKDCLRSVSCVLKNAGILYEEMRDLL